MIIVTVGGGCDDNGVNYSVSCVFLYLQISSSSLPAASLLAASLLSLSLLDLVRYLSGLRVSSYTLVFSRTSVSLAVCCSCDSSSAVVSSFASASGRGLMCLDSFSVGFFGMGELMSYGCELLIFL